MFDINKVKRIAKEVGVEVNPLEAIGRKGLFFRNENGQLEKWDAITELGLKDNNTQHSNYYSNFFDKSFYTNKVHGFNKSPYRNTQSNYSMNEKINKQTLISEAA
ncbi:TPA: hypothetical protein O2J82_001978 [Staphylococcus aureus]|nr:hypothetical protein [Staphylococcus aureus]